MHARQRLGGGDQPMAPRLRIGLCRCTGVAGQRVVFARFPRAQRGTARIGQALVERLHAGAIAGRHAQIRRHPQLHAVPLEHEALQAPQDLLHVAGPGTRRFVAQRQQDELSAPMW